MVEKRMTDQGQQIIEKPIEARQAERGPTVFNLLAVSTIGAIVLLAIVWFVFFWT